MPDVRLFCALDARDRTTVEALAARLAPAVDGFKLGLEYFCAHGPAGLSGVVALGRPLFLDLKLHDIPNTVAGAVQSIAPLAPAYLTLHASGGAAMLRAAAEAARSAAESAGAAPPRLLAVTVLTSLDDDDLATQGVADGAAAQVRRLATVATSAGLDGLVASPHEITALRAIVGHRVEIAVPGIRPAGAAVGDQKRVMSPAQAVQAGASLLVIGRPITQAADPLEAARAIRAEIDTTLAASP